LGFLEVIGLDAFYHKTKVWKILLEKKDITHLSPSQGVQEGIVHCPEGRQLFPRMSVRDNLLMGAFLRKDNEAIKKDLERLYSFLPILGERRDQLAITLSGGEQQILAIGRAIMSKPKILMLDEPSLGLSPLFIEVLSDIICQLGKEGITIILVEQNASLALEISGKAYVLQEGKITLEGESKKLIGDERIREAYLGIT
jgi:branched-chain amino acid transport system ATP-binding protein